ncbi:ectoine dioxygenase-like [Mya arenaria]|uniref:ectoine dioxygenase-like n=1 Tax=Mya arenaria TaxID=6604 RepID=UPI0022E232DC|nr:ectoine dioxygenase-like [Mya arenaria]
MIEDVRFDGEFEVTDALKNQYDRDGFLIVRNLLDKEEIAQLWKIFEEPDGIMKHSYETSEPDDKKILRVMYRHPGNDVSGIISRSEKIVNACEKLLDGEVYHYHGKFIMKNPREGGQHVWHQDYGYWYKHNLFPDMITVWMAMDKTTRQNSCLQLLKGSHKCGRINHVPGDATLQTGADLERVEALKPKCPHLYAEMEPGDVLFQHCNLLHTSEPNNSDMRRWAFVACYNKASNDSFLPHHHANYVPIEKVTNSAIKDCRNYTDFSGKDFTDPIKKEEDRMHFPPTEVKG